MPTSSFRVRDKWEVELRRGKRWHKIWNWRHVDTLAVVDVEGSASGPALEIVNQTKLPVAPMVAYEISKNFRRWMVPMPSNPRWLPATI